MEERRKRDRGTGKEGRREECREKKKELLLKIQSL